MSGKQVITLAELSDMISNLRFDLLAEHNDRPLRVWGVPRGGVPVAVGLTNGVSVRLASDIETCHVIVDDLIDSGATLDRYTASHPGKAFAALIDKRTWAHGADWVVFPWEGDAEGSIEDNVRRLLQYVGEDPTREGLLETPGRVAKAWESWCSGYAQDPADVLKVFEDGAGAYDEMVVVKDIPVYSTCEHHMASIFGSATVAYIPDGKVVGLSKLARLVDIFARRLQVQERLTVQIADALMGQVNPKGCAVLIKARHMCMESRGISRQGAVTVTSALRGAFKQDATVRNEFMALSR